MLDDLLAQIECVLRDDNDSKDGGNSSVNITVGDNCTVIVAQRNRVNRRRRADKPKPGPGSHGRRDADQALHQELEQLRYQVRALERLAEHLLLKKDHAAFKCELWGLAPCLTPFGAQAPNSVLSQIKASRRFAAAHGADRFQPRAAPGFVPIPPATSHVIPVVS